jgi:hypothetical protein
VVDDFPEDLSVSPGELRVIETYLAQLLDDSFKPTTLDMVSSASEIAKRDVE